MALPLPTAGDVPALPAEPFNAVTSLIPLVLVLYWILKLRGRFRRHAFVVACLPLLSVVLISGALFHVFPNEPVLRLLDWAPAFVLALAACAHLWSRVFGTVDAGILASLMPNLVAIAAASTVPQRMRMHIAALFLAANAFIAALSDLRRRHWENGSFVFAAMACFFIGVVLRVIDPLVGNVVPTGTHSIWHLFGGATAHFMLVYIFRSRERELALKKSRE